MFARASSLCSCPPSLALTLSLLLSCALSVSLAHQQTRWCTRRGGGARTATLPQARCCAKWSEERACFDALAPESDECIGADQIKALLTAIHPSKDGVSEEDLDAAEVRSHHTTRPVVATRPATTTTSTCVGQGPPIASPSRVSVHHPSPRKAAFERASATRAHAPHRPPPTTCTPARGARCAHVPNDQGG